MLADVQAQAQQDLDEWHARNSNNNVILRNNRCVEDAKLRKRFHLPDLSHSYVFRTCFFTNCLT